MINIGNIAIDKFYLGSQDVSIYLGDVKVYPSGDTPPSSGGGETLQWVSFNSGDVIPTTLDIYGIRGNANEISFTFSLPPISFTPSRANIEISIWNKALSRACYNEIVSNTTDVEYIFSDIGCDDYVNWKDVELPVLSPVQLLIMSNDEGGGESVLPDGYTEAQYVQNSAERHYISSNRSNDWVLPNDGVQGNVYKIKMELSSYYENRSDYVAMFGSTYGYVLRQDAGYGYNLNIGSEDKMNYSNQFNMVYDSPLEYTLSYDSGLTIVNPSDGSSETYDWTSSRSLGDNTADFGLFCFNMPDSGCIYSKGKIYYVRIEGSDGTLKHNYVPAVRNSDSAVGMYDTITNTFHQPPSNQFYQVMAG